MKTIGVIGGIGPQATMDFEWRLHVKSQELIPPKGNSGYPGLVVGYLRESPVITDEGGRSISPLRPSQAFLDLARSLGPLCDFIVITSNGMNHFDKEASEAAGKPVLNMPDLVVAQVKERGWQRAGVLGLGDPVVYTSRLPAAGIGFETIQPPLRDRLDVAILKMMEGQATDEHAGVAGEAVYELFGRGLDGVILGCTEIPLLLGPSIDAPNFVNPIDLLVDAAVRRAMED